MASIQQRGDKFQLRVKHRLLPKPFFFTFDDEASANTYGEKLEAMLARGVVPAELTQVPEKAGRDNALLATIIRGYRSSPGVAPSDDPLLAMLERDLGDLRAHQVDYRWVEGYVRDLKVKANLAPGTIRKRVGSLARALDWHHRRTTGRDQVNPFRLLPRGYSSYSKAEAKLVTPKVDEERDRRLAPGEEAAIRRAMAGEKRPDKERALVPDPALQVLFDMLVDGGFRLSEAFRMRVADINFETGVVKLQGSKGERGKKRPRTVPLKPALRARLKLWCEKRSGLVLPFWDGTPEGVRLATNKLSERFANLFSYAGVEDLTAHDLRHEATCRWWELRDEQGRWALSEMEIYRLMGWTSPKMGLRYASLRGEDMVARLG